MGKTAFKTLKYSLGDFFGNILLTVSIFLFQFLPLRAPIFIARILGIFLFHFSKRYRERVIGNLSMVFKMEKDLEEMMKLAKEVFFHFTLTSLEIIYMIATPFKEFLMNIEIIGREHLDAALAQGKGVIALGAHLGSFPLLGTRLAAEGYSFNVIVNEGKFPKLMNRMEAYRRQFGQKSFPPKPATAAVKKSLNSLYRNEILYLIADEQQRRGGIPVPFFGQKAFTPPGPAILSLKTGAPILPMFVLRENGIPQTLIIGNPINIERTFDDKKDAEMLTAKFTLVIEEAVRHYPSQWAWLNRRWKLPYQKEES